MEGARELGFMGRDMEYRWYTGIMRNCRATRLKCGGVEMTRNRRVHGES